MCVHLLHHVVPGIKKFGPVYETWTHVQFWQLDETYRVRDITWSIALDVKDSAWVGVRWEIAPFKHLQ